MAAWQFQFTLVPEAGIRRVHGELVGLLPEYQAREPDAPMKEASEFEDYWEGIGISSSVVESLEKLLPERASWSRDARMFGREDGNAIEIWNDEVTCCIDMREFDLGFLSSLLEVALMAKCKIVSKDYGRVIEPVLTNVIDEANRSRAKKFVDDPIAYIRQKR